MEDNVHLENRAQSSTDGGLLTSRQRAILEAIGTYYQTVGEPCPGSYLARRLSLHHSTVQKHLFTLHRKGWLRAPNAPAVPRRYIGG